MLLEMGVRVWHAPGPGAIGAPLSSPQRAQSEDDALTRDEPSSNAHTSKVRAAAAPGTRTPAVPSLLPATAAPEPASGWSLLPTRLLYPDADPALTPAALGAGWLVVAQSVDAGEPWAEGAERLLAAMLQALQLQLHPRVALCALQSVESAPHGTEDTADITADITAQVAAFAPSVVLLMGRGPVRAALGLTEPLAKLRELDLRIAGVPVVATYDAPFLLRNPQCKRSAWADLCRARALAGLRAA